MQHISSFKYFYDKFYAQSYYTRCASHKYKHNISSKVFSKKCSVKIVCTKLSAYYVQHQYNKFCTKFSAQNVDHNKFSTQLSTLYAPHIIFTQHFQHKLGGKCLVQNVQHTMFITLLSLLNVQGQKVTKVRSTKCKCT